MQVGVAGVLVVAMRQKAFLLFSACVLLTCVFIIMLPATTRQHGLKTIVKVSFLVCRTNVKVILHQGAGTQPLSLLSPPGPSSVRLYYAMETDFPNSSSLPHPA
jgi:hypothetical protein